MSRFQFKQVQGCKSVGTDSDVKHVYRDGIWKFG